MTTKWYKLYTQNIEHSSDQSDSIIVGRSTIRLHTKHPVLASSVPQCLGGGSVVNKHM